MTTHPHQAPSALYIILGYTVLGVLVGTLLIFGIFAINNIIDEGFVNILSIIMLLPYFLLFGGMLGGIPALLTGIVVAYNKKLYQYNIPTIMLKPTVVGFIVSFVCAWIAYFSSGYISALNSLLPSLIFASIGAFSGFVVSWFIKTP